jgi:hypothetical protein
MVIITQLGNTNVTTSGVIHLGISDHSLVPDTCRKISTQREKPKIVETSPFKHFNSRAFESDLNQAFAANGVYHHDDPNEIWNVWKTIFLSLANKHAPPRQRKVRSTYNPWINTHNSIYYFKEYIYTM